MLWVASVTALTLSIIAALLHSSYRALGCTMVTVHQSLQRKEVIDRGIRDLSPNGSLRRGARYGASANRSLSHTEPISRTSKRKLENGKQRLTPENHRPGTKSLKIAGQRLGHTRFPESDTGAGRHLSLQ